MANLIWLRNWFDTNTKELESKDIQFSFSEISETDNSGQFVDIDTENNMARVTLWKSGDCDFEMIENESAKQVVFEHQEIKSEIDLSNFLTDNFTKFLGFR